jgi:CRISPR system Cascade subunit CasD
MAEFLVFTLAAPIASFGIGAGNFSRGSEMSPGHSLIVGVLGAALGLEREDARLLALSEGVRVAVAMEARGAYLRDFHTVESRKERKGPRPLTRRQALADKKDLYTTISERDYVCDVAVTVAVKREGGPFSLAEMAAALRRPRFTLYLGRKSCPLALPPAPEIVAAETADAAMREYRARPPRLEDHFRLPHREYVSGSARADARLYSSPREGDPSPPEGARRSRRRTLPGARAVWSYRLLDELTLRTGKDTP